MPNDTTSIKLNYGCSSNFHRFCLVDLTKHNLTKYNLTKHNLTKYNLTKYNLTKHNYTAGLLSLKAITTIANFRNLFIKTSFVMSLCVEGMFVEENSHTFPLFLFILSYQLDMSLFNLGNNWI